MGLIPDDTIADIRSRADIVSVIGQHVQLKRAGRNWKGLCPFHGEKSPSFNVAPDKGFFYCFGCHKKGDVFTFVMELLGKSFIEAAETLAAQCGVVIPETVSSPDALRARGERSQMLEVNRLATTYFAETLAGAHGQPGRDYLDGRGIDAAQRAGFALGYATADWTGLGNYLKDKRADLEIAFKLGLIGRSPRSGGYYDRFRERVVCPIALPGNEIAGFSARLVGDAPKDGPGSAKYINSPESTVYKKSRLLFGLAQARESMRTKGRAVLVEGNFDVVSMHQAGFTETVAPLGTALTGDQVELLRRFAGEVVLFYDGDRAGRTATRSAIELLVAAEVPVRIAWSPRGDDARLEGQDPDSLLRAGVDVASMIDRARGVIEFFTSAIAMDRLATTEAKVRAVDDLARLVARVVKPTERAVMAHQLAEALGVDQRLVLGAIDRASRAPRPGDGRDGRGDGRYGDSGRTSEGRPGDRYIQSGSGGDRPPGGPDRDPNAPDGDRARTAAGAVDLRGLSTTPPPAHELDLLGLLADHPALLATTQANKAFSLLTDDRLRDMYSAALGGASLAELAPDRVPPSAVKVILSGSYAQHPRPEAVLDAKLRELHVVASKRRTIELERQLAEAKKLGDADRIRSLVLEVMNLRKQVD